MKHSWCLFTTLLWSESSEKWNVVSPKKIKRSGAEAKCWLKLRLGEREVSLHCVEMNFALGIYSGVIYNCSSLTSGGVQYNFHESCISQYR